MGDGVNIAARLEGVATPGAICLSEQAYWQAKGRLDLVKMIRALERGARCKVDPTEGWDPWPVMNDSLDGLRERYGITPLDAS